MHNSSNKLYSILLIACTAGYIWLYYNYSTNNTETYLGSVCFFKRITSIPCPSCGSTRSVLTLLQGNLTTALYINPFGFVIALVMLLTPFWITIDIVSKKRTLFNFYQKIELELKKRYYAIPLILLVVTNWIWNIIKGL